MYWPITLTNINIYIDEAQILLLQPKCYIQNKSNNNSISIHGENNQNILYFPATTQGVENILSFLKQYKNVNLNLLLDLNCLEYTRETLPDINYFDRKKISASRLLKYFPTQSIRKCYKINKFERLYTAINSHKILDFLLDSAHTPSVISMAINFFPLILGECIKKTHPSDLEWHIIISLQKSDQLSLTVLFRNNFFYTRTTYIHHLSRHVDEINFSENTNFQTTTSEQIYSEILDLQKFLARHGLHSLNDCSITCILPANFHSFLKLQFSENSSFNIFTPFYYAKQLNIPFLPKIDYPYLDVIFLTCFQNQNLSKWQLFPQGCLKNLIDLKIKRLAWRILAIFVVIFITIIGGEFYHVYQSSADIRLLELQKADLVQNIALLNATESTDKNLAELQKSVELKRFFDKENLNPNSIYDKLSEFFFRLKSNDFPKFKIKSFTWSAANNAQFSTHTSHANEQIHIEIVNLSDQPVQMVANKFLSELTKFFNTQNINFDTRIISLSQTIDSKSQPITPQTSDKPETEFLIEIATAPTISNLP